MHRALALVLLAACTRSESAPPGTDPKAMTATTHTTRISELSPRRGATRLLLTKDRAVFLGRDHLTVTPLTDKGGSKLSIPIADAHALGMLGDDIVVGINATGKTALVRFAPGSTKGQSQGGILAVPNQGYGRIFATDKASEIFIGGPDAGLDRSRIDPDRIVPIQAVAWKADEQATFTSAGHGRVAFVQRDRIVRIGSDGTREEFKLSAFPIPAHLVAGPSDDTMWITEDKKLGLLELAHGEARVTRTVDLGALAFDLASGGDAAAVITATGNAAKMASELQVIGADGKLRWRAALPPNNPNMFVAASADRVAVQIGDELRAWNAKDGSPVALPAP